MTKRGFQIFYVENPQDEKVFNIVKGSYLYLDLVPILEEYNLEYVGISQFEMNNSLDNKDFYECLKKMYEKIKKRKKILVFKLRINGKYKGFE